MTYAKWLGNLGLVCDPGVEEGCCVNHTSFFHQNAIYLYIFANEHNRAAVWSDVVI